MGTALQNRIIAKKTRYLEDNKKLLMSANDMLETLEILFSNFRSFKSNYIQILTKTRELNELIIQEQGEYDERLEQERLRNYDETIRRSST